MHGEMFQVTAPTAIPTDEQLVQWAADGVLLSRVVENFDLASADFRGVAKRCGALDVAGQIDLLQLIESGEVAALPGHDFFTVQHFYLEAIPELGVSVNRMVDAVDALVDAGGGDLSSNRPYTALLAWCRRDTSRAHALIAAAERGDPKCVPHLAFGLQALGDPAEARRFVNDGEPLRRASAMTALARMEDPDAGSRAQTIAAIGVSLGSAPDDMTCANALQAVAAVAAVGGGKAPTEAAGVLERAMASGGDGTRYCIADVLWTHPGIFTPRLLSAALRALLELDPDHQRTLDELDLGLTAALEAGFEDEVLAFVAELLVKHRGRLKAAVFDSVMRALVSGPPARLSRWVISWLLSGEVALGSALSDTLSKLERDEEGLPIDRRDLPASEAELGFLARKAVGWFMLQPYLATSILVAILGVCGRATAKATTGLLIHPVLRNYPEMAKRLAEVANEDPAKPWLTLASQEIEAYLTSVRGVGAIAELQPSEAHRRTQHLHHADDMRAASKAAEARSVLMSFVHRSTLLYGVRSLSYVEDVGGGPRRPMEFELGTHEISMLLPRLEMTDPIGLQMIFAGLRLEPRPA